MTSFIPKVFRYINSKLITTENVFFEKLLKVSLALSVFVYRKERKKVSRSREVIINNFDSSIKMKIDPSRSMGAAIYWTGFHEFREFIFLHRYLKKDMVFVDVGANQGEYSLFAAKRLTHGHVLAFEPLPSIQIFLKDNIQLNAFENIKLYDLGLSDSNEMLKIYEIENVHEGLATLYPGNQKSRSSFEIRLALLDDIFPLTNLSRLDFIKIDIEGGELKALKGSIQTIKKLKPTLMVEINDGTYKAAGYGIDDISAFFAAINYLPYEIGKRGRLRPCAKLPTFGNIIFKPR